MKRNHKRKSLPRYKSSTGKEDNERTTVAAANPSLSSVAALNKEDSTASMTFTRQQKQSVYCLNKSKISDDEQKQEKIKQSESPMLVKDEEMSSPVHKKEKRSFDEHIKISLEKKKFVETEVSYELTEVQAAISAASSDSAWNAVAGNVAGTERRTILDSDERDNIRLQKEQRTQFGIEFINSIMKEYSDIPGSQGMKVLKNVMCIEEKEVCDVVIRNITEDFWKTAIQVAEAPNQCYRVCAVGTPGIGKSLTTAILIRLLLQQGSTVVYRVRTVEKKGWVYEFKAVISSQHGIPSSVVVTAIPEAKFDIQLTQSLAGDSTIFYVVDPGRTNDDCCPDSSFKGRFILVSSPDECHWGGTSSFLKRLLKTKGKFLVYPFWSLEELLDARPYIQEKLSVEAVIERYRQVGGVPRQVFELEGTDFEDVLKSQSSAVNKLTTDQLESIAQKEWDDVATMSQNQPKSSIMGYGWSGDSFNETNAVAISTYVVEKIVTKHKLFLWNKMTTLGVDRGSGLGWLTFEVICRNRMIGAPFTSIYKDCVGKGKSKETCELYDVSKNNVTGKEKTDLSQDGETDLGLKPKTVSLGGCTSIKLAQWDIIEAARATPMVVFHSANSTYKLIDFAYQNNGIFYAFQVTLSESHKANVTEIQKLASAVGGPQFLQLYYLVPYFTFNRFVTDPVNPAKSIQKLIDAEFREKKPRKGNVRMRELETGLDANWIIRTFAINNPNSDVDTILASETSMTHRDVLGSNKPAER